MVDLLRPGEPGAAPVVVSGAEIDGLPAPVRRYLRTALDAGLPTIRRARFNQQGEFLLQPEKDRWRPFTAEQHVTVRPHGFVWDAGIRALPGLTVRVRDAFLDGKGITQASLLALIPQAAEVEWLLPDGPQAYWRGLITRVCYEFDEPE